MINFEDKYNELQEEFFGKQKKILVKSSLKVFYGVTTENNLRISFMSTIEPLKLDSTKDLKVSLGQESEDVYWTCFDLLNPLAKKVFYSFCEDIVESITCKFDESEALVALKNRYYSWQSMFKAKRKMSPETNQGLFGELYFINNYLIDKYSADEVIDAWAGPDGYSKDFSLNKDWFEVKTILSTSQTVKISSITQLTSNTPGILVVIKVDKMSESYSDGYSDIFDLFNCIMLKLKTNQSKEKFIAKLLKYGFDIDDNANIEKYKFVSSTMYNVDNNFPRLTQEDIKYQEIGKITYELILSTLDKYKKEN